MHIDSAGPFQLVTSGSNAGTAWRHWHGQTDSVAAYAIWGCAGDGGTYRLNADSTISFTWSNGQQYQFFGPSGIHRLLNDTLIQTTSEESYRADSTHAHLAGEVGPHVLRRGLLGQRAAGGANSRPPTTACGTGA